MENVIIANTDYFINNEWFRFGVTNFSEWQTLHTGTGAPSTVNGELSASMEPGLGIQPLFDVLGEPVLVI